jgi:2'-5' RNA ligase
MRAFIAFPLPLEIKEELKNIQDCLRECKLEAKWVEPINLHLTLKFLGEISSDKVETVKRIIQETAARFTSLTINLIDFGFFPTPNNPRVFFIATDKEEILKGIADYLEDKLEKVGFKKEGRFKSHITLARLKSKRNIDCILRKIKKITLSANILIRDIVLFKSTLKPSGPIYEEIFRANFAP